MHPTAIFKPYSLIAPYYPLIMSHINYNHWSKYIITVVKEFLPENPALLELAAGNCTFAEKLGRNYKDIVVSDLSVEMLKEGRSEIQKICCSMISLPFKKKFDMVFSLFDSVNYLLSKKSLKKLFLEVSLVLKENGIFVFDASLEKNSLNFLKQTSYNVRATNVNIEHQSGYNPVDRIHTNKFKIMKDGLTIGREVHRQRIYSFETFFELIEKSGMYVVHCYEAFTKSNGKSNSDRILFILKRK